MHKVMTAILAALPPDGTVMSFAGLVAAMQQADPSISSGTVSSWLSVYAVSPGSGVLRVGYGRYRVVAIHGSDDQPLDKETSNV